MGEPTNAALLATPSRSTEKEPPTYNIILMRHGESCANVTKEEYGGNPFTMFAHTFYSDPELSGLGLDTVTHFDILSHLDLPGKYIICSSALLRAQETAFYLSKKIPAGKKADDYIRVLPYINELGNTADNKPLTVDERIKKIETYEEDPIRSKLERLMYVRARNPHVPDPKNFEKFLIEKEHEFKIINNQPGPINLLIVTHNKFMSKFQKEILKEPRSIKYNNLDFMKFTVRLYTTSDTHTRTAQFNDFVPYSNMLTAGTFRKSCEREDNKGGRCRKQVCRTVRRPAVVPAAGELPSLELEAPPYNGATAAAGAAQMQQARTNTASPEAPPYIVPPAAAGAAASTTAIPEDLTCVAVRNLMARAGTAKYATDILPVAKRLSENSRPGFKVTGDRVAALYKPGWFTTRSTRRLPEDMSAALQECKIPPLSIKPKKLPPGATRYGLKTGVGGKPPIEAPPGSSEPVQMPPRFGGGARRTRRRIQRRRSSRCRLRRTHGRRQGKRHTRRR
jgi:broad specificity phosphatase PhoE